MANGETSTQKLTALLTTYIKIDLTVLSISWLLTHSLTLLTLLTHALTYLLTLLTHSPYLLTHSITHSLALGSVFTFLLLSCAKNSLDCVIYCLILLYISLLQCLPSISWIILGKLLAHSLTHSLTHSLLLTHFLTHLLTYSLTHSLTHLLTYLLIHLKVKNLVILD